MSQVGLLAVTIFIYLYTVVPVYEKDKLTKEIANKEKQLAIMKTELDNNYEQLRSRLIGDYIYLVSLRCNAIQTNMPPPIRNDRQEIRQLGITNIFHIDIPNCLSTHMSAAKALRKLRPADYEHLKKKVAIVSETLELKRNQRIKEYIDYPKVVAKNPNLLPELYEFSYPASWLKQSKGKISDEEYTRYENDAKVKQGLLAIEGNFMKDIVEEIASIQNKSFSNSEQLPFAGRFPFQFNP
ncbi:hypothetical protein [Methylotenera sp. 1P/1]|uniref:hypothetical protein n=1 Tax=Methylotenera sp. 1P/1 TaxID=1131551 RepID=UPI00036DD95A|nr:hypothetical protein [Methylotenera sp. 1P/1]